MDERMWELCLMHMSQPNPEPHSVELLRKSVILAEQTFDPDTDMNNLERVIIHKIYHNYLLWAERKFYLTGILK